ncbi:PREDICTED: uncharacterized protein LOC104608951 isoform X2 [Nelumbo nucifera]|uniref:Uncharacterized protein LOC104608951 isoform X2 n=1 Tax=Nelumbo nucifera TaxID=4432 RepID=A0A1U8Q9K7_NELNU|nr:PREDICTED: uncharacterized protein LOC104608951 isoform X2 [Nelumbo nucifera]
MPSGAKKRKAAKKKEQVANIQSPTNSQGNDDLKTHDEKESDSGYASSPTSEDHHHALEEEEEEENKDYSALGSVAADTKAMEESINGSTGEGENKHKVEAVEVLEVVRELKPDENSEGTDVVIEHVEYAKDSRDGGSSGDAGSSSTSSDDESQKPRVVEKNSSVTESEILVEEKGEGGETLPPVESVEPVVALSEGVSQILEAASESVDNTETTEVVVPKEKEEQPLPSSDETSGVSGVIDLASKENEGNVLPSIDAPPVETSKAVVSDEHHVQPQIPESSETQQVERSAPPAVQPTSWKSCCGLFDVLTGSNR